MAVPVIREDFKEYCLRKLGKPVIEINVSNTQIDDRVDEALKWYWDYHYDGTEKVYYKSQITQETQDTLSITLPDNIISVTGLFTISSFTTSMSYLFDVNYYVALDTLYHLNQAGMSNYYTTRMNYQLIQEILVGQPMVRFSRHNNTLHIDINKQKLVVGAWLIIEGYQKLDPADMMFSVDISAVAGNTVITTANSFYGAVTGSFIISPQGANNSVSQLVSNTQIIMVNPATVTGNTTITIEPPSDVWSDMWLQRYTTALIKQQWGSNLTKFTGMPLPGGITFNGEKILNDATDEIRQMREELVSTYSLPAYDMVG